MLSRYFNDFNKKFIKVSKSQTKASSKKGTKKTTAKKTSKAKIDVKQLKDKLGTIIPSHLVIDAVRPIDSSGFSPDGVDLIAYNEYCSDILEIMGGYIPHELIYGTYHIVQDLDKGSLTEVLNKIITVKKLNEFSDNIDETDNIVIPSFVIALNTKDSLFELKNDILNYYISKNIEHRYETDILVVLNKGIVVKDWKEKRSFIALETKGDTSMWFFILMNEYLDAERKKDFNLRNYVKKGIVYNEY